MSEDELDTDPVAFSPIELPQPPRPATVPRRDPPRNSVPATRRRPRLRRHAPARAHVIPVFPDPAAECSSAEVTEPRAKRRRMSHDYEDKCPICLEPYTTEYHGAAALKCGHLFGARCIKSWLRRQPSRLRCCPLCRTNATLQDVRRIYASRVVAIDDSQIGMMQVQLEQVQAERDRLKFEVENLRAQSVLLPPACRRRRRARRRRQLVRDEALAGTQVASANQEWPAPPAGLS